MNESKIMEKAVLLRVYKGKAGNVRKGDLRQVQCDADKSRLKLGKVRFISPEYKAVITFDNEITAWVNRRAINVDVGMRGVCLLPRDLLGSVDAALQDFSDKRADLVETFMGVYSDERNAARERMNGQFSERDYPDGDKVRAEFSLSWSYVTFGVADGLPPELAAREQDKLRERFGEVERDVTEAMRVSLRDLVGHLSDRLQAGPDGKAKIFRDSAVGNLVEFLELFSARNVTDDTALADLASKAQGIIAGVSPQGLRDKRSVRESVRDGLEQVKTAVSGLIETMPGRKFNFDD